MASFFLHKFKKKINNLPEITAYKIHVWLHPSASSPLFLTDSTSQRGRVMAARLSEALSFLFLFLPYSYSYFF
jgi:hypothetical protein